MNKRKRSQTYRGLMWIFSSALEISKIRHFADIFCKKSNYSWNFLLFELFKQLDKYCTSVCFDANYGEHIFKSPIERFLKSPTCSKSRTQSDRFETSISILIRFSEKDCRTASLVSYGLNSKCNASSSSWRISQWFKRWNPKLWGLSRHCWSGWAATWLGQKFRFRKNQLGSEILSSSATSKIVRLAT